MGIDSTSPPIPLSVGPGASTLPIGSALSPARSMTARSAQASAALSMTSPSSTPRLGHPLRILCRSCLRPRSTVDDLAHVLGCGLPSHVGGGGGCAGAHPPLYRAAIDLAGDMAARLGGERIKPELVAHDGMEVFDRDEMGCDGEDAEG